MKNFYLNRLCFFGIVAVLFLTSCGTQNVLTKARKSGVLMEYNFPENYMNYKQTQKIDQTIEAQGQLIDMDFVSKLDFETKKNSNQGDDIKIVVKLNSADMSIEAMGQNMGPDLSNLAGKEFHLVVAKNGKELDTHEAEEIVFQTSPEEKSNLGMMFSTIFPDLPGKIVKVNDAWTSRDSIKFIDGEKYTVLVFNNFHTLNDFVELDGINCAEIKSSFKGYMKGKSFTQGMEMDITGDIQGNGTWYFDFENGRLIRDSAKGFSNGKITMSMGEMPMERTFDNTTELVK